MPKLSDAELVTLAVMQAMLGYTSEAEWFAARETSSVPTVSVPSQPIGLQHVEAGAVTPPGGIADWDILEDIPNGSAAALILLEHQWAVPLPDTVRADGQRTSDEFTSPLDLIEAGLYTTEEAAELHARETSGASA
jgi:hypothetical protein